MNVTTKIDKKWCSVVWQDNQCVITNSSHMVNFYWDTDEMLRS